MATREQFYSLCPLNIITLETILMPVFAHNHSGVCLNSFNISRTAANQNAVLVNISRAAAKQNAVVVNITQAAANQNAGVVNISQAAANKMLYC